MAEKHEGYESVGCLEKDIRNHLDKDDRLTLELEDADAMLQCFMLIQEENPRFFFMKLIWMMKVARNVFWVDANVEMTTKSLETSFPLKQHTL